MIIAVNLTDSQRMSLLIKEIKEIICILVIIIKNSLKNM